MSKAPRLPARVFGVATLVLSSCLPASPLLAAPAVQVGFSPEGSAQQLVLSVIGELGGTMMLAGLLLPALLILGTLPLATTFNQRRLLPRGFFLYGYVGHLLLLAVIAWLAR